MGRVLTCTWAPTVTSVPRLSKKSRAESSTVIPEVSGPELKEHLLGPVREAERLGIDCLLVAQRWWGTGDEIEGSTYDCLATTALYAAATERIRLITAIHPGFFLPAPIAKWGASIDRISGGRWAINVTSGWHEVEFAMYGAELLPHDDRYARSREFIEILRRAWKGDSTDFDGRFYKVRDLRLEPRPLSNALEVWQGGQSEAAIAMAAECSDWMFLNGGPPEKIARIIEGVRKKADEIGRRVRFALYSIPLCRETDAEAETQIEKMVASIDPETIARKRARTSGARGMWSIGDDPLTLLDTNEGFASRLIGSPDTILRRIRDFHALGVDCFHLTLNDRLFNSEVLPRLRDL
jgi:FMNH2-dependent dimethyl sulfone monooxygenase